MPLPPAGQRCLPKPELAPQPQACPESTHKLWWRSRGFLSPVERAPLLLSAADRPGLLLRVWIPRRALTGELSLVPRRTALTCRVSFRIMPFHALPLPFARISFVIATYGCILGLGHLTVRPLAAAAPPAMWGSLAAQPLVQWSGRAQRAVAITSLRQFGRGGAAGVAPPVGGGSLRPWAPPGATVATSSPPFGMLQQRGLVPWRIAVAQQLHTLADPAGPAAGGAACRIQPGEVHLWWLDPSQVSHL